MTVIICDRCRKAYDPVSRGERDLVLRMVNNQVAKKTNVLWKCHRPLSKLLFGTKAMV